MGSRIGLVANWIIWSALCVLRPASESETCCYMLYGRPCSLGGDGTCVRALAAPQINERGALNVDCVEHQVADGKGEPPGGASLGGDGNEGSWRMCGHGAPCATHG